jgi:hypothetical protein
VKVGDLVKTISHPHAKDYPESIGIVTHFTDHGLHSDYNSAIVLWPATGDKRPVRQMFLEVISERG